MSESEEPGRTPPYIADVEENPPTPIAFLTPSPPESPSRSPEQLTSVEVKADVDLEQPSVPEKKVAPKEDDDDDPWKMTKEEYEGVREAKKALPQGAVLQSRPSVLNSANKGTVSAEIQRKRTIVWTKSTGEGPTIDDDEAEKLKKRRLRFGGDLDPPANDGKLLASVAADGSVSLDEVIVNRNITYAKKIYKSKDGEELEFLEEEMEPSEDYDDDDDSSPC